MKAKKHLGQHFLNSKTVLKRMVGVASVQASDTILEIGPGKGVLTHALLETGAHVIVVETDLEMIPFLETQFAEQLKTSQLKIIHADILDVEVSDYISSSYKLVANIPYYITGEIIRRFLTAKQQPTSMTLLVQKEVAARIARDPKGSILSMSVKAYGVPQYIETVPARYFSPPPKVDSAILHISNISKRFFENILEDRFFKVVKLGFSNKRKKLINNLASFGSKDSLSGTLKSLGLHENIRAEELTLEDWRSLATELK